MDDPWTQDGMLPISNVSSRYFQGTRCVYTFTRHFVPMHEMSCVTCSRFSMWTLIGRSTYPSVTTKPLCLASRPCTVYAFAHLATCPLLRHSHDRPRARSAG